MFFKRINPSPVLEPIIECYWVIQDDDPTPKKQKIIPDGFTEVIFHFGDPYRIKLGTQWEVQSKTLIAGQITKHFLLENTGRSNILGIKLKPTTLTHLFDLNMSLLTDTVVNANSVAGGQLSILEKLLGGGEHYEEKIGKAVEHFQRLAAVKDWKETAADIAIGLIFEKNGMTTVTEISQEAGVGERQLENLFRKYVGLSPKFFSRIVRFNYIFELVQRNKQRWSSLAYEAAYYDQSHFIRNFKDFTGENPSDYAFDEKNIGNFFLNKK